jgi:hypothetical protein
MMTGADDVFEVRAICLESAPHAVVIDVIDDFGIQRFIQPGLFLQRVQLQ